MLCQETLKAVWEISGAGCWEDADPVWRTFAWELASASIVWVAIPLFLNGTLATGTDEERARNGLWGAR